MAKYESLDEFLKVIEQEDPELRAEIEFEKNLIVKMVEIRESQNVSQRDLAEVSGLKQPAIARIEQMKNSPRVDTLIRLLVPLGYTLAIVPLERQ